MASGQVGGNADVEVGREGFVPYLVLPSPFADYLRQAWVQGCMTDTRLLIALKLV